MSIAKTQKNFTPMFTLLWTHRDLITQLIKRDILHKYRGSFAGILWALLTPILMLGLYTLVFGIFIKLRWPGVDSSLMYSLTVYVGLILFGFFAECLTRSPTVITNNTNLVKKVIFPLEIYPWVLVGTALFQTLINTLILALFCWLLLGKISATILFFPIIFLPLILITLGFSWFFCALGVYVKDIVHAMGFILQVIMYLSPVLYATSLIPKHYQTLLLLNPLTYIIEQMRNVVILGNSPQWSGYLLYLLLSLGIAWLGFMWFQHTKDGFADVL